MSFSISERTEKRRDPCSLIGYGEIGSDSRQSSFGFARLGQTYKEAFKADPRVVLVKINDMEAKGWGSFSGIQTSARQCGRA